MPEILSEVLANLGEAITEGDFNDAQRYLRATLFDGIVEQIAQSAYDHPGHVADTLDQTHLFAIGGGAHPYATGAARTLTNAAGTIGFKTGAIDGRDPKFYLVHLAAGDLSIQVPVGDPINPRIDTIGLSIDFVTEDAQARDFETAGGVKSSQVMLKKRALKVTRWYVGGTPQPDAALVEPALPVGARRWASVYVPANFNAPFNATADQVRDHRFPIGRRIQAHTFADGFRVPFGYALNALGHRVAGGGPDLAYAIMPTACDGWAGARCLAAYIDADIVNTQIDFVRLDLATGAATVLYAGIAGPLFAPGDGVAAGSWAYGPRWADGHAAGIAANRSALFPPTTVLALRFVPLLPGATVRSVRWEGIAG